MTEGITTLSDQFVVLAASICHRWIAPVMNDFNSMFFLNLHNIVTTSKMKLGSFQMKACVDIVSIYSHVLIEQHYTISSLPMSFHCYSDYFKLLFHCEMVDHNVTLLYQLLFLLCIHSTNIISPNIKNLQNQCITLGWQTLMLTHKTFTSLSICCKYRIITTFLDASPN